MSESGNPPKDAATVILLRERTSERFEVFMVRRHQMIAFMGGAYVFPGGKVDAADCSEQLLRRLAPAHADALIHSLHEEGDRNRLAGVLVAAVRETLEEAGVWLGPTPTPGETLRVEMNAGTSFADLVASHSLTLDPALLVATSRWITPVIEPRRYDTRFFLAKVPATLVAAHDQGETTDHAWWTPKEALAKCANCEINLPPPTMKTLQLLAEFRTVDDALDDARSRPPPCIQPEPVPDGAAIVLAFPGDPLHPEKIAALPGPTRLVLENGRWWARS